MAPAFLVHTACVIDFSNAPVDRTFPFAWEHSLPNQVPVEVEHVTAETFRALRFITTFYRRLGTETDVAMKRCGAVYVVEQQQALAFRECVVIKIAALGIERSDLDERVRKAERIKSRHVETD